MYDKSYIPYCSQQNFPARLTVLRLFQLIRNSYTFVIQPVKKLFTAILAILYFTTTTGATVHMHYCMGKLDSWSLLASGEQQKECGKCGMDKQNSEDNGCCKDELTQLKIQKEHQLAEIAFQGIQQVVLAVPVTHIEINEVFVSSLTEKLPSCNAPPRSSGISTYKLNCVFRI